MRGPLRGGGRPLGRSARRTAVLLVFVGVILIGGVSLFPPPPIGGTPHGFDPEPASCVRYVCLHPWIRNATLTITNSQSSPTGTYQQLVVFPSSSFKASLNGNLSNLYFVYAANGTTVPAWIEANASNTSGATWLWLRLYSIPATSSVIVSALMAARGSFLWSVLGPVGVDPQSVSTSSGWGKFDDGAQVFNSYANFSGSSLPSGWAAHGGWSFHQSSGLWVTAFTCLGCYIASTAAFAAPAIVEFYGNILDTSGGAHSYAEGLGTSSYKGGANASYVGFNGGLSSDVCAAAAQTSTSSSGATCASAPYFTTPTNATWGAQFISTSSAKFTVNYAVKTGDAITANLPTASTVPLMVASGSASTGTLTTGVYTAWIRERTYEATPPTVAVSNQTRLAGTVAFNAVVFLAPTNVSLSWAWSDPTTSPTNYTLYLGPSCALSNTTISAGTATTEVIHHLLSGVEYCAIVQGWVGSTPSALSLSTAFVPSPYGTIVVRSNVTVHTNTTFNGTVNVTVPTPHVNVTVHTNTSFNGTVYVPWTEFAFVDLFLTAIAGVIAGLIVRGRREPRYQ